MTKLDGQGRPYITLVAVLKFNELAPTGGQAKALVRSGAVKVNGQVELRPTRKLHAGDTVEVGDAVLTVELQQE